MPGAGFDLADEFGGEAEVGGDHVLGDALDELREIIIEVMIEIFTG